MGSPNALLMKRVSDVDIASLFRPMRDESPLVEDVTMDERRKTEHLAPCVRRDLKCGECGSLMVLRKSKKFNTPFYGCSLFPACKGACGAYADGRPKGTPSNRETSQARIRAHVIFDRIWQQKRMTRDQAYAWMRQVMGIVDKEAHIGHLTAEQCDQLITHIRSKFPGVRSVWDRLKDRLYSDPREVSIDLDD
jgi:ssDNA-binding Zn-finger/Zn-ribbon topoisomerase 1